MNTIDSLNQNTRYEMRVFLIYVQEHILVDCPKYEIIGNRLPNTKFHELQLQGCHREAKGHSYNQYILVSKGEVPTISWVVDTYSYTEDILISDLLILDFMIWDNLISKVYNTRMTLWYPYMESVWSVLR